MLKIDLSGKNALIGGASQGIGKATAQQMAACGANVHLLARNESKLAALQEELAARYTQQQFAFTAVDHTKVAESVAKIKSELKQPIHILVNNSGGPAPGPAHQADSEAFLQAFRQHLIMNQELLQLVLEDMKKAAWGRVLNVISTSVKQPLPNLGVSNTVRGAVANWAKTIANELAPFGITVNNILPGATATDRLTGIITNKAKKGQISEDAAAQAMKDAIPAKRFGEADELAYAACFLASDLAAYINGINLPVDGGRTSSL